MYPPELKSPYRERRSAFGHERHSALDVAREDCEARCPHHSLTPRERAVLRHASAGLTVEETAEALGDETIRSHFKKAQAKLGTRNRTHTVAEAMRELLIV